MVIESLSVSVSCLVLFLHLDSLSWMESPQDNHNLLCCVCNFVIKQNKKEKLKLRILQKNGIIKINKLKVKICLSGSICMMRSPIFGARFEQLGKALGLGYNNIVGENLPLYFSKKYFFYNIKKIIIVISIIIYRPKGHCWHGRKMIKGLFNRFLFLRRKKKKTMFNNKKKWKIFYCF